MTVANETIKSGPYTGDGVTTEFSYDFKIVTGFDIAVYETDLNGDITKLQVITDYVPNNIGEENGTVTLASPLTTGHKLLLVGDYERTQETAFSSQGAFFPTIHEDAMDKLTRLVQQLNYLVGNGLRLPDGYAGDASAELPVPEDKKLLRYSDTANAFVNTLISELLAESDAIQSDLRMNGNRVTNMGDGVDAQDAATIQQLTNTENSAAQSASDAAQSAQDASNTLDDFQNRYWGAYSSEPSLSPVGDPATAGDLYFNTTEGLMKVYDVNAGIWTNTASAVNGLKDETTFTNVAGQNTFPFNYDPKYVDVFYNGARLIKDSDYDASSGTQVVLNSPVTDADDSVTLVAFNNVDFVDLGTAAFANVQTGPTDTTAGVVLTNGSHGLGVVGQGIITTDLHTLATTGFYNYANTAANIPSAKNGLVRCEVRNDYTSSIRAVLDAIDQDGARFQAVKIGASWSAWQPVYTGANYQPEISLGLGVVRIMSNKTGANVLDAAEISGANLRVSVVLSSGAWTATATTPTGTWKHVSGATIANNEFGYFVRTA